VSLVGEAANDETDVFDESPWPVIIGGSSLTEIIRVGQSAASTDLSDRTSLENLTIDMTNSPVDAKGVYCEHGVNWKTLNNIYIRGATPASTAALKTANQTGFHLAMSDGTAQGLYYLQLNNLTGFNLFRGFYTLGDSNDGLRVSTIGRITVWNCAQGITFIDSECNQIDQLGIQSFMSDYDPSTTTKTITLASDEWGIYMDHKNNSIGNIYIEGISTETSPHVYISAQHSIAMYRDLDLVPNSMQVIMDSGLERLVSTRLGNNRSLLVGPEIVEVGTLGGVQTQESLTVNPNFQFWTGGHSNISTDDEFAYSWKAHMDEATCQMAIHQRTGSSLTEIYNSAVRIELKTGGSEPVADNLYGIKQDLVDYYPPAGSYIETISRRMESVTIAALVQPYSTNTNAIRMRIEVDQGSTSSSENYTVSYTHFQAGVDEPIQGDDGHWWTLIHHVELSATATKFEIKVGIYPTDDELVSAHIDSVLCIAGRHTQYGTHPYIEPPNFLNVPSGNANTNTPSGGTAHALPIFNADGSLLGHVPVYSAEW